MYHVHCSEIQLYVSVRFSLETLIKIILVTPVDHHSDNGIFVCPAAENTG